MAKTLQFRRYNTAVMAVTTGSSGELIVNTDANTITVHDGVTAGGWATTPIAYAQAAFATANANTVFLTAVNTTQNTGITAASSNTIFLQGGLNTANANTVFLLGALSTANANTIFLTGIENSQNANIVSVQALANTDYTILTTTAGVYGNSSFVPVITLSANGRVSSIVNTAILFPATYSNTNVSSYLVSNAFSISANIVTSNTVSTTNVIASGLVTTTGNGIGYATGSGGVVIQSSSRTTGVTLNKPSGLITLFSTTMANTTSNTFIFTNSTIAANDFILLNHFSGGTLGNYTFASNTSAGQANVTIRSVATVPAEAPVIQFVVIKGAAT